MIILNLLVVVYVVISSAGGRESWMCHLLARSLPVMVMLHALHRGGGISVYYRNDPQ